MAAWILKIERNAHQKARPADASWEAANVAIQTLEGFGFEAEHVLGLPRSF